MAEPLGPIEELQNLKFSVRSLGEMGNKPGSYEQENRHNAVLGIIQRIDWVVRQLEAAGEGQRNMGV